MPVLEFAKWLNMFECRHQCCGGSVPVPVRIPLCQCQCVSDIIKISFSIKQCVSEFEWHSTWNQLLMQRFFGCWLPFGMPNSIADGCHSNMMIRMWCNSLFIFRYLPNGFDRSDFQNDWWSVCIIPVRGLTHRKHPTPQKLMKFSHRSLFHVNISTETIPTVQPKEKAYILACIRDDSTSVTSEFHSRTLLAGRPHTPHNVSCFVAWH